MNVLEEIDQKGEVTSIALEAQAALQDGDTDRSARLFRKAGEMLEASVAGLAKPSERDLARFLAATHYYKGGAYPEAARLGDRIPPRRLPSRVRHLYPPFLKDVRERSAPGYLNKYRSALDEHFRRAMRDGDLTSAQKAIDLLKDHPYLIRPIVMAYVRARCCEVLGKRRAATLFYRRVWQLDPDHPVYPLAYLDSLCKEGKHAEAQAIVEQEQGEHPGARWSIYAMSVINAILIRIRDRDADAALDEQAWRQRRKELLDHFHSAMESIRSMSPGEKRVLDPLIDYAFLLAWVSYLELDDIRGQNDVLEHWIESRPQSPRPYELRGLITYPGPASERDFREAVRLGSKDPLPYYFLAHDALTSGRFLECERQCDRALRSVPEPAIRAELLVWQAVSRWSLGRDRAQVRPLLAEARNLRPDDVPIAELARAFEENGRAAHPPVPIPWEDDPAWVEQARRRFGEEMMRRSENERPHPDNIAA